jgi:hypothetical protein
MKARFIVVFSPSDARKRAKMPGKPVDPADLWIGFVTFSAPGRECIPGPQDWRTTRIMRFSVGAESLTRRNSTIFLAGAR